MISPEDNRSPAPGPDASQRVKRKVNLAVVAGGTLFLLLAALTFCSLEREPPASLPESPPLH